MDEELLTTDEPEAAAAPVLTPLQFPPDFTPGKYAAFYVSPEPMFGPDELGVYKSAIEDLSETVTRADSSARVWEVMQTWEARMFERGYQFNSASAKGWGQSAGQGQGGSSPAGILQFQQTNKLFAVNVYSARCDKITAALSREVPGFTFVPKRDSDPVDQTAADEAKKYLKCWLVDAGVKSIVRRIAQLFYTDDRVIAFTGSWADEQRWGTETPEQPAGFGAPVDGGVTPETEQQPDQGITEVPAVREVTEVDGKLEWKVPIYADHIHEMPWVRRAKEINCNILKERYPWIEDKISAGASVGGAEQIDRMARINVRLAVQTSTSSGESWQQDATETYTWYRPSQYRAIKDKDLRKVYYDNFPDGLLVVHAGSELAYVRNASMDKCLRIMHPKDGSGQNRRAIGTNYLPLQKILNANISLIDRILRAGVPRRYAAEGPLDVAAMNQTANDPGKVTAVVLEAGQKIQDLTGTDNVSPGNPMSFEFVQWLIEGAPEVMDGAQPAMFGGEDDSAPTFGGTRLKRDQALQVFSMPWSEICTGLAMCAEQAAVCASENRVANMNSNVPGQGKLEVEIGKLRGNFQCFPESMEIPQTIAEQEQQMAELLENADKVALYKSIVNDPRNLTAFKKFPSLSELTIPGVEAVEQQQGEFELLMQSGPLDNPQVAQAQQQLEMIQQQIQQGQTHPEAQTPEGQQAMQGLQQAAQQLQQQITTLPPKVSSVPVAQDGSENHAIHAAITLGMLEDSEGRKLKNGTPGQQQVYANLHLHWMEHDQMVQKLTPPVPMEFKGSVTIDPSKYSPDAQAKMLQAAGLQVAPEELQSDHELVPHEITVEKEGTDANGVPVKQKTSMVNPGGKLQ